MRHSNPKNTNKQVAALAAVFALLAGAAHAKSIQSYSDGGYIVHAGESPAILVTDGFQQSNGQWKKVAGLASSDCVSFESVYSAGYYLRHYNFEVILTKNDNSQVFREDATFCERPGLGEVNHTSFEAYNYPGYYIKHSGTRLGLIELDAASSEQAKRDATFSLIDDVVDGQIYYIQNRNSGKCLRTLDSSTADAASIVQYSCGHSDAEQWQFKSIGNHEYNIIQVGSGKFADIDGASTSAGGNNIIWPGNGRDNQKWEVVDQGDGFFHIVNVHSGLLLDISSGSSADNANNIQWPDNQGTNQDWRFIHASIDNFSSNPILSEVGVDLADPDVIYANNRFYLYPTTVPSRDWLSTNMHVYSSSDFVNWQDDGEIVSNQNFTWEDIKFWAPAIEARNGKFYFYFSLNHNIAVAVADSPTGPFTDPLGAPLVSGHIDPDVFVDDDGQGYLYYGQGYPRVKRLNEDMISTTGPEIALEAPNMREGIYMFKRNGVYYLSWSVDDARSDNYHVEYSMGQSPLGPFEYQGVLLEKAGELVGTGHHSIIQMPDSDDWYIVYHRHFVPDGGGQYREIATQRLTFNSDGTIQQVVPQHTFKKPVQ